MIHGVLCAFPWRWQMRTHDRWLTHPLSTNKLWPNRNWCFPIASEMSLSPLSTIDWKFKFSFMPLVRFFAITRCSIRIEYDMLSHVGYVFTTNNKNNITVDVRKNGSIIISYGRQWPPGRMGKSAGKSMVKPPERIRVRLAKNIRKNTIFHGEEKRSRIIHIRFWSLE